MAAMLDPALAGPEIVILPGGHDALSARIAVRSAARAVYMTGFGVAGASFGVPDIGLVGPEQMTERVRAIVLGSVGVDSVDVKAATARGLPVTNCPDTFIEEVADHAMMLLLSTFRRAIELDPKIPDNYYDLALLELSDNRLGDAARLLEKYLTLKPGNAQAHLLLGRAEHNLNETIPAIAQFKKALELAPDLPLAHYHLGFAYQSQGDLKPALEEFKKEIEINPTFYDSYCLASEIELEQGNLDGAAELYRRALALRSGGFEAHYGLARVLMAQGHQVRLVPPAYIKPYVKRGKSDAADA